METAIYWFKFEPSSISNLAIPMSLYSVTKFSILFALNVINRFIRTRFMVLL